MAGKLNFKENFPILFSSIGQLYAGRIYVARTSGFYYYLLFLDNQKYLFFVNEDDCWIEHGQGETPLAATIGACIDCHYHPGRFLNNPPVDPE